MLKRFSRFVSVLSYGSLFSLSVLLRGQVSATPESPNPVRPKVEDDDPFVLSTFHVVADDSDTYEANNTLGVTGTNRDVRTLPLTMQAFTRTMIDDIAATNLNEVLSFGANIQEGIDNSGGTGIAGSSMNGGNGQGQDFRIRGLLSRNERRRNGFLSLLRSDTFDLERAEILRGPQSLLYGQGVSSGTINTVTKQPIKRQFEEIRIATDQYGTIRASTDVNHNFGTLGVRLNALSARQRFWYDNLFEDTHALDLALSYRLAKNWTLRGSIYRSVFHSVRRFGDDVEIQDNSRTFTNGNPTFLSLINPVVAPATYDPPLAPIIIDGKPLSERNAFSIVGGGLGTDRGEQDQFVALEGKLTKHIDVRLAFNHSLNDQENVSRDNSTLNNASQLVFAPTDSRAVADASGVKQYSINFSAPQRTFNRFEIRTWQTAAVYSGEVGKFLKTQIVGGGEYRESGNHTGFEVPYEVDDNGNFVMVTPVNAVGQRTGRIQMAAYAYPINGPYLGDIINSNPLVAAGTKHYKWGNVSVPVTNATTNMTNPGNTYVTDNGATNVANGAPFGNDPQVLRDETEKSAYLSWLGTWFNGRLETMAGARTDNVRVIDSQITPTEVYHVSEDSGLVGVIVNVVPHLGVYANRAKSFTAASAIRKDWDGKGLAPTNGVGQEIGLKFDLFDQRVSGSFAYFENSSNNENFQVPQAIRNAIDPVQMGSTNNRYSTQFQQALPFVTVPNKSHGYELGVSVSPLKGLRISLNAGIVDGRYTADISHEIYYNDQFYTRTSGGDTIVQARLIQNGVLTDQYADVLVRSIRGNAASPLVPLTVAMLTATPASTNYGVSYDVAGNGRVSNWATFFPTGTAATVVHPTANSLPVFAATALPTGFTSGGVIATGALGLPISQHQLGFVPNATGDDSRFLPGTQLYRIFQANDKTGGYPERTLTMNSNYTISSGRLRGISMGANFRYAANIRRSGYTSYTSGDKAGTRELVYAPDNYSLGLQLGYRYKFSHVRWDTQLNVSNVIATKGYALKIDDGTGNITGFSRLSLPPIFTWTNTFTF